MQHQGLQCGKKPSPYSDALSKKEAPAAFHKDGQTPLALYSSSPALGVIQLRFLCSVSSALSTATRAVWQCGTQWELTWSE